MVSDHSPSLGGSASILEPANAPFRFQQMWLTHGQFMEVVQNCWTEYVVGDPAFVFQTKIKIMKKSITRIGMFLGI